MIFGPGGRWASRIVSASKHQTTLAPKQFALEQQLLFQMFFDLFGSWFLVLGSRYLGQVLGSCCGWSYLGAKIPGGEVLFFMRNYEVLM